MATIMEGKSASGSDPERNGNGPPVEKRKVFPNLKITGDLGAWVAPLEVDPGVIISARQSVEHLRHYVADGGLLEDMEKKNDTFEASWREAHKKQNGAT